MEAWQVIVRDEQRGARALMDRSARTLYGRHPIKGPMAFATFMWECRACGGEVRAESVGALGAGIGGHDCNMTGKG